MIGSMPHSDPQKACSLVAKFLPEIPTWPQLPKRSFLENMYAQYSEGFPGVVIEGERVYVDRSKSIEESLEQLYTTYLEQKVEMYAISRDYAVGLHTFCNMDWGGSLAVKGQVTGPVTWGLVVTDESRRSIIYDETLADAVAKHLHLKAAWVEKEIRDLSRDTIVFLDEPYMHSIGSAFVSLPREQLINLLEEAFAGISGMKGIHCCGNTDWSLLLATSLDILSFDAYNYGYTIALYPQEVKAFLGRGGVLAWGIVGRDEDNLKAETVKSLLERLTEEMGSLEKKGVPLRNLLNQCLITPSCGLAVVSEDAAERALELLAEVSMEFRSRYIKKG
jgi:methionine synthase II (cobalamin-independent)